MDAESARDRRRGLRDLAGHQPARESASLGCHRTELIQALRGSGGAAGANLYSARAGVRLGGPAVSPIITSRTRLARSGGDAAQALGLGSSIAREEVAHGSQAHAAECGVARYP